MKRKKMPLWLGLSLGFLLAVACMFTMFIATASVADPELYKTITTPIIAFATETLEKISLKVVDTQEKAKETQEYLSEKAQETQDYVFEKALEQQDSISQYLDSLKPVEPDSQEFLDSQLDSPREIADFSITHFNFEEFTGVETLTGGTHELVYFNQTDEQWGNYGHDSISGYGCGPTSMAMIVSTLTGTYYNPQEMADIFVEEQFWASRSGTYYSFADGSGSRFQLTVEPLVPEEITASYLMQHLMSGKLAIALMSNGHFTSGGHYIVLRGTTLTGDILVADPASRERSLTTWDPQLILDELSSSRYHGAPLWLFSPKADIFQEESILAP